MCELTYVKTGDARRNRMISYALAFINSNKHKDGVGFYQGGAVWKTSLQACNITNMLSVMQNTIKTTEPVILHTRFATIGAGVGKEVCDANSHPFDGKKFVLAHNGTLTSKTAMSADDKKAIGSMTDSEYFLTQLEKSEKTSFVEAINETMVNFTGKFAFLIHDKRDDKDYAIRGWSAGLFWIPITVKLVGSNEETTIGYVINTEKDDLIRGLILARNLCFAYPFYFSLDKIVEMKKETIYDLSGIEPVEVGTIKENFPQAAQAATTPQTWTGGSAFGGQRVTTTGTTIKIYPGKRFVEFCENYGLTIEDADMIVFMFLGKNIAELNAVEITWLDNVLTAEFLKRVDKKKLDTWEEMVVSYTPEELYESGVSFPYFLEELPALTKTLGQTTGRYQKGKQHAKK